MTRIERWSRVETALGSLEEFVDAVCEVPDHPDFEHVVRASDAVHCAMSMAGYAVEGDYGVDPPPRGACRRDWREAYYWLKNVRDRRLKELVAGVRVLLR